VTAETPSGGGSVAGSTGILLAARLAVSAGYFLAVLLLAHALDQAQRGAVAFVTVTALVLSVAGRAGVGDATMVLSAQEPERRPTLLSNLVAVAVVGPALAGAAVSLLLLGRPGLRPGGVGALELVLLPLAAALASVSSGTLNYLRGCSRFRLYALVDPTVPWLYAAALAGIWLVRGDVGIADAIVAWTCAQAFGAICTFGASLAVAGIAGPDFELLRRTTSFGVRAWPGSLADFLTARVDQTIMGFISTERRLGVYAVAVNAGEVVLYLPAAVASALLPAIASSPPAQRCAQALRIARALLVLAFVSVAVAAVAGALLIPVVFGSQWQDSVVPFLCLLPGTLGFTWLTVFAAALLAAGSPGRSSLGSLAALLTGVALDFVLMPRHGASGAAIAATAAYFAGGIVAAAVHRRLYGYALRELVPRRDDVRLIRGLVARVALRVRRGDGDGRGEQA
jgi:O-antigen/teichoic acid export membrane protein